MTGTVVPRSRTKVLHRNGGLSWAARRLIANNFPIVIKRALLPGRSDQPDATATAPWPVPSAKGAQARDGLARMIEYLLLVVVSAIVVAAVLPMLEQGWLDLIKRVGRLLASGR